MSILTPETGQLPLYLGHVIVSFGMSSGLLTTFVVKFTRPARRRWDGSRAVAYIGKNETCMIEERWGHGAMR
jgi:hypothetical protein